MFVEKSDRVMTWEDLGDVGKGRPHLGDGTPVVNYRLMEFTMRRTLEARYGEDTMAAIFRDAGRSAGKIFCQEWLDTDLEFDAFVSQLQQVLADQKIGILKLEESNLETLELIISVYEDLDCSGLPNNGATVCDYDEGFIAGILEVYTGREFSVREIDCWAAGGRVCRFRAEPV